MNWLNRFWHRKQMDEQVEKELSFHMDEHIKDLIAQGCNPEEARRRARLELGHTQQVKEQCRDARGTRWFEDLLQDFRYALRMLGKNRRFRSRRVAYSRAWHRRDDGYVYGRQRRAAQAAVLS